VYGCSLHLLGAIWSSLANLLLHLAREVSPKEPKNDNKTQPNGNKATTQSADVELAAPPEIILNTGGIVGTSG